MKTIQTRKSATFKAPGSVALIAVILAFSSSSLLALTLSLITSIVLFSGIVVNFCCPASSSHCFLCRAGAL
jgi:hypothetical protein